MSARRKAGSGARAGRDGVFWFMIHANPKSRSGRWAHWGGAYVSCFVRFPQRESALIVAKHWIRAEGWRVRSLQAEAWFTDVSQSIPRQRRFHREALRDGASFVYNRYPRV